MLIDLELNYNDLEALLRHCHDYTPRSEDAREDRRLMSALETLAEAIDLARLHTEPDQG